MMYTIRATNLRKVYSKRTRAVEDLSFEVKDRCVTGFVGRNGAGKTTTINILAGIVRPTGGQFEILGKTTRPGDWKYKSEVGFVLEKPAYLENLTGHEYLQFVGLMQRLKKEEARQRIDELLNFLELGNEIAKPIKEYSKGMKKKISLAAALIHNPRVLILDEPLEGIDPVSASQIKALLKSLVGKGKSVLISSHELGTVQTLCDEFIIIEGGRAIFQGTINELREKLASRLNGSDNVSLEELFLSLVGEDKNGQGLSWL